MATVRFDGVDDYILSSATSVSITGAITVLAVARRGAIGAFHSMFTGETAAGAASAFALEFHSGNSIQAETATAVQTTATYTSITDWQLHCWHKAAGASAVTFTSKNLTTLAATVHDLKGVLADPAAQAQFRIGNYKATLTDDYSGDIALVAVWDLDHSNAQMDALLAQRSTSALYNDPVGRPKILTEVTSLTPVDLIGNTTWGTAVGATLVGADPDGWLLDGVGGAGLNSLDLPRPVARIGPRSGPWAFSRAFSELELGLGAVLPRIPVVSAPSQAVIRAANR